MSYFDSDSFIPHKIWDDYLSDHLLNGSSLFSYIVHKDLLWQDFMLENPQYFPSFEVNFDDFRGEEKCSAEWLEDFLKSNNENIDISVFSERYQFFDPNVTDVTAELNKCLCGLFFSEGVQVGSHELHNLFSKYPFVTMYLDLFHQKDISDSLISYGKNLIFDVLKWKICPNIEIRFGSLFHSGRINAFEILCIFGNMYTGSVRLTDNFTGGLAFDFDDRLIRSIDAGVIGDVKQVLESLVKENKLVFMLIAWVVGIGLYKGV